MCMATCFDCLTWVASESQSCLKNCSCDKLQDISILTRWYISCHIEKWAGSALHKEKYLITACAVWRLRCLVTTIAQKRFQLIWFTTAAWTTMRCVFPGHVSCMEVTVFLFHACLSLISLSTKCIYNNSSLHWYHNNFQVSSCLFSAFSMVRLFRMYLYCNTGHEFSDSWRLCNLPAHVEPDANVGARGNDYWRCYAGVLCIAC